MSRCPAGFEIYMGLVNIPETIFVPDVEITKPSRLNPPVPSLQGRPHHNPLSSNPLDLFV
jgi:hypothetical protein